MLTIRLLLVLLASAGYVSPQQRSSPLTIGEVEELIRSRMPDSRLAVEINRLGIKPLLNRREVQRLRELGAGPEAQSALELHVLLSSLTIISDPPVEGLTVTVGDRTALTNSQGRAQIAALVPGSYELVVEKAPAYLREAQRITVPEGDGQVHVTPHLAPGKLSVLLDNGRVEISSLGTFEAPIGKLEIPAGTYSVSITAPQSLPYSTLVTIEPGETISIQPTLVPDRVVIDANAQKKPGVPKSAAEEKKAQKEAEKLQKQRKEEQKRNDRALSNAAVSGCNNDVWVALRATGKVTLFTSGSYVKVRVINMHSFAVDISDESGVVVRNLCPGGSLTLFRIRNFLDKSTIRYQYHAIGKLTDGSFGSSKSKMIIISGSQPRWENLTWEIRIRK